MSTLTSTPYTTRFHTHLEAVRRFLEETLEPREPQALWAAMRHGVLNGGKRIRPVLLLETCLACGGAVENALPTAGALELIHCYSLIHDDLPCMDDDDLRRGQPTVHRAFSEALAVLAGDALAGMAFGLIADHTQGVPDRTLLRVISELSRSASVEGLVNGQVDDILSVNMAPDATMLHRIHSGKTGALFRFSARAGAWLAGQPLNVVESMGQYGNLLGLAFQIVDDLLDVQSSGLELGKTPGKDQAQGKMTFPAVYGIQGAQQMLDSYIKQLDGVLDGLPASIQTDNLRYLVRFVQERKS